DRGQAQTGLDLTVERPREDRPQVLLLLLQTVVPAALVDRVHEWSGDWVDRSAHCQEMSGVPASCLDRLTGRVELLQPELPQRVEHGVPGRTTLRPRGPEQALGAERRDPLECAAGDRLGGVQAESTREHREPAKEALLLRREEIVAPGDRRAH